MSGLPPCEYRGPQVLPGSWECRCPALVVPGGTVTEDTCRLHCPVVQRAALEPAARAVSGEPRRRVDLLVSCLMPTGNRPEFAAQAIRCFQAQDYPHRELIVVDSGTPGLSRLADRDARIKYVNVVGSSPMSIGAKRNLACREAQGDILICWDDDDWYGPSRISKQTAPLVHGQCDLTGVTQFLVLELMSGLLWRPSRKALRSLFSTIVCGTAAFRREVLRRTCFPDVSMGEDVAFVRVAVNSRARLLPVAAGGDFVYVRHGKNTWSNDAWYRQAGSTIVKDSPWGPAEQRFYDSLRHATAA